VLDEPTNSLDLRACRDFTACLSRLARQGTALILVTHHLPDIVPEIDRVVVLADGRVRHDGTKREILRADLLSDAFGVSLDIQERDGFFTAW
jgi:iron complex transport system ATP-binding protein